MIKETMNTIFHTQAYHGM